MRGEKPGNVYVRIRRENLGVFRRTGRGYYEMDIRPLASPGEPSRSGDLIERYARLVEDQIHAAPSDWPWSHKRWKLKKSVYHNR